MTRPARILVALVALILTATAAYWYWSQVLTLRFMEVIAYGEPEEAAQDQTSRVGFVFDRSGFADWKLTEIRLPSVR